MSAWLPVFVCSSSGVRGCRYKVQQASFLVRMSASIVAVFLPDPPARSLVMAVSS